MGYAKRCQLNRVAVVAACAIGFSGSIVGSSFSQDIISGSAQQGASLADRFCSNCHLVDDKARNPVPVGIPTFLGIANKPGQTGTHIIGVLMAPHSPMPNINLTREEIGDIIAYLQTFRADPALPPLLPAPQEKTPKPAYPAPT